MMQPGWVCPLVLVVWWYADSTWGLVEDAAGENPIKWANTLGFMLSRSCMYGFGISGFYSLFDQAKNDRRWMIGCAKIPGDGPHECHWTYTFVNAYQMPIDFECDTDEYIAGLYSDYDIITKDRKWRLECCKTRGVKLPNCVGTDWVNKLGGPLEFSVPPKFVLHGIYGSYHEDNHRIDRKWKFTICDMEIVKDEFDRDQNTLDG